MEGRFSIYRIPFYLLAIVSTCFNTMVFSQTGTTLWGKSKQALHKSFLADSLKAEALYKKGVAFSERHEYDSALFYFNKSIDVKIKMYGEHSRPVILAMNVLGGWYAGNGEVRPSLEIRYRALELAKKTKGAEEELVKLNNNLGRLHFVAGDYERALPFLYNGLRVNEHVVKKLHFQYTLYKNITEAEGRLGNYEKALRYAALAEEIFLKNATVGNRHPFLYTLSILYADMGKVDSAIVFCQKALDDSFKQENVNNAIVTDMLTFLSSLFFYAGLFSESKNAAAEALHKRLHLRGSTNRDVSGNYRQMGTASTKMEELKEADSLFQLSLRSNNFHHSLHTVLDFNQAFLTFSELGHLRLQQFAQNLDIKYLSETLDFIDLADQALTLRRQELYGMNAKERTTESAAAIYETGVAVCLKLKALTGDESYWQKAFYFSERRKSIVLSQEIYNGQVSLEAGVQAECLEEHGDLLRKIAFHRHRRTNVLNENDPADAPAIAEANRQIHLLTLQADSLLATVEQSCPMLSVLKNQELSISVDSLQLWCKNSNTSLVEYFLMDTTLVTFAINSSGLKVVQNPLPNDFPQLVGNFKQSIAEMDFFADDKTIYQHFEQYRQSAHQLYDVLIKPIEPHLKEGRRLMVIPDGQLAYLPFAALLEKEQPADLLFETADYPYFIHRHPIAYCYSATLLQQMEEKQHLWPPDSTFLGIAPDFTDDGWGSYGSRGAVDDDLQIRFNMPEVDSLQQMIGGVALTGTSAIRSRLMDHLFSRILHFATHAIAFDLNSENSYLALQSPTADSTPSAVSSGNNRIDPLYLWEITHLSLSADMVFLSACETGLGRLTKTEGIVSLARAFAFGGAKNIHATLWSIKDYPEGVGLVLGFYKNLYEKKMPKDVALQQAQLAFLEKHKGTDFTHPHFWAAFIGIGDRAVLF